MKRRDFLEHMERQGCVMRREGAKHTIFFNPENGHVVTIPRHREIESNLVRKICHQLGIGNP